jgi:hypothetical protein
MQPPFAHFRGDAIFILRLIVADMDLVVEDRTLNVVFTIGLENVTTFATYEELVQRLDRLTKKESEKGTKKRPRHTLRLADNFMTRICHFISPSPSIARPFPLTLLSFRIGEDGDAGKNWRGDTSLSLQMTMPAMPPLKGLLS